MSTDADEPDDWPAWSKSARRDDDYCRRCGGSGEIRGRTSPEGGGLIDCPDCGGEGW